MNISISEVFSLSIAIGLAIYTQYRYYQNQRYLHTYYQILDVLEQFYAASTRTEIVGTTNSVHQKLCLIYRHQICDECLRRHLKTFLDSLAKLNKDSQIFRQQPRDGHSVHEILLNIYDNHTENYRLYREGLISEDAKTSTLYALYNALFQLEQTLSARIGHFQPFRAKYKRKFQQLWRCLKNFCKD